MASFTVLIHWPQGTESINIDSGKPLRKGQQIHTFESWPGYSEPTRYNALVLKYNASRAGATIQLRYETRLNNEGQARENESWGVSTLEVDFQRTTATASWTDDDEPLSATTSPARVFEERLYEALGFSWLRRRNRRQVQFRKSVMKYGARCALTKFETLDALEAAHIVDADSHGGYSANNGLMLRADLHRMFDSGTLMIEQDGTVSWAANVAVDQDYLEQSKKWRLEPEELRRISAALKKRRRRPTAA
jgi:hypothetical protein